MSSEVQPAAPSQVAKAAPSLKGWLESETYKAEIAKALPAMLTPERFLRVALTCVNKTPKLAECSQGSVLSAMMSCASLGIEPDNRRAYLIPYGKDCQLIISYMGLIELVRRSGEVASIRAETVCEKDEFAWLNGEITHKVDWRNPRGDVQAVYAVCTLKSGESQSCTMTRDEVEAIRKRSKAGGSGPWVTDWAEMAKKTAIRRLCKLLPFAVEAHEALEREDDRAKDITPRGVAPSAAMPSMETIIENGE